MLLGRTTGQAAIRLGVDAVAWTVLVLLWRRNRRLSVAFGLGTLFGGAGAVLNLHAQGLLRDTEASDADEG